MPSENDDSFSSADYAIVAAGLSALFIFLWGLLALYFQW